ncbi:MAG: PHP domain-containing protein [Candidatus Eisenbacteria bacterium]
MSDTEGRVDLHVHTIYSDGDMTPEDMVLEARKMGLAGIAITDHDEIGGVEVAMEAAGSSGFEVVPGVELSTVEGKSDLHILGYMVDMKDENLLKYLQLFRDARRNRGIEMVERLRSMGVDIKVDSVLEIAGEGAVGRPHIAAALLKNGCVETLEEAFKNYIGFHSPAYVHKYLLKPSDAFNLIAKAGGIGAVAHPGTSRRDDLIADFMASGMRAIEVYHPKHRENEIQRYSRLADKMGLVATGGSDSHGRRDGQLHLGSCTVPFSTIEQLKRAKNY